LIHVLLYDGSDAHRAEIGGTMAQKQSTIQQQTFAALRDVRPPPNMPLRKFRLGDGAGLGKGQ
jgi:hypothetical protein